MHAAFPEKESALTPEGALARLRVGRGLGVGRRQARPRQPRPQLLAGKAEILAAGTWVLKLFVLIYINSCANI